MSTIRYGNIQEWTKWNFLNFTWSILKFIYFYVIKNQLTCSKWVTKILQRYENNVQQTLKRDMERYGVSLRIQSECGKIRTRITSNTDAFYAVIRVWFLVLNSVTLIWEDLDAENGPKVEQTFDETFYRQNILTDKIF